MLRYSSRIFSFENFSLRRSASSISLTLRFTSRAGDRMRFFTSCWVIVEPPCSISPDVTLVTNARNTAPRSMPSFVQKVRSSVAITALITARPGSSLNVTFWRSWSPSSSIFVTPSDQYTVDFCERSRSFVTVLTV